MWRIAIAWLTVVSGCSTLEPMSGERDVPSFPALRPDAGPPELECSRDADCVLMPYVTCCGECPPSPPFDVGSIHDLDAILIEREQVCAERRPACEVSPQCEPVPAGCEARAACVSGACLVIETGCAAVARARVAPAAGSRIGWHQPPTGVPPRQVAMSDAITK